MTLPAVQLALGITTMVVLAGAFAATEVALARVSRARAAELVESGRRGSARLSTVAQDPAPVLSVITFLRTLAETGAVVCVTVLVVDAFSPRWYGALVSTGIMTAIVFIAVGVGPRTLGRQHSERWGLLMAPVALALTRVLGPLAKLLVVLGNALTPGRGYKDGPFASEAELRELVDMAGENQVIEADEREMIHSVFEFGDTLTREVMVPRTALVSIEGGKSLRSAMSLFLRSGFSRVPVTGDGLDDVVGMLYIKDVARRLHEDPGLSDRPVTEAMRQAVFVPDSKPVDELLREMQRTSGHVVVVVDEYGGVAGMVTLEDLVEEIVGEISDEYDRDVTDWEELGEGTFRVRSRLHLGQVGDLFGIELEDEEVDTVGGLLAKLLGRVPITGAQAKVSGLILTADRFEGRRNQLATLLVQRELSTDDETEQSA